VINPLRVASDGYLRTSNISIVSRGYIFIKTGGKKVGVAGKRRERKKFDFDKENNEMLLLFDIFTKIV